MQGADRRRGAGERGARELCCDRAGRERRGRRRADGGGRAPGAFGVRRHPRARGGHLAIGERVVSEFSGLRVLVLGGGPDAEREVSLRSAAGVASALREAGCGVVEATIGRVTADELRALEGDVVFPVLHGSFGEGGGLQDLLEADGRAYVGCGARAARLAMDKLATKAAAWRAGVPTADAALVNPHDEVCALDLPVVVKPVHEGSSVGLRIVRTAAAYAAAVEAVREHGRPNMVEAFVRGRELTVGVVDLEGHGLAALPIVEIAPASGVYDYQAKYERNDTRYTANPDLPSGARETVQARALTVARAIGVRHLARVDFLLDEHGEAWLLELNTMPGFTATSLLPMAGRAAGIEMPTLCARLAARAMVDGGVAPEAIGGGV
ncbi:MAG: D-alanine--D-alanine ligase [Phycisphaerales bacterium]|nr:MAG: D-alanine--D-alanine ligase [Phycisphaerales bacterium]